MLIRLDPALATENGKTAAFIPLVSGGSGEGYWNLGTGTRWRWTTKANKVTVRCFTNQTSVQDNRTANTNLLCYRINGKDMWAGASTVESLAGAAIEDFELYLGVGLKTFELFVPVNGVIQLGQPALGCWPMSCDFNAPAVPIAPVTTGAHRGLYGDSILTGMDAMIANLQGVAGLMKMGKSDPYNANWKGVYAAGTTYAVGDICSYGGSTWGKKTAAAAGTVPAVGADWQLRGFDGRVTQIAHGFRRLIDDCANGTAQTNFAAFLASLGLTELDIAIGTNDWYFGWSAASFQAALTGLLNALFGTSIALIPIKVISPLLTTGREVANSYGNTMDDYRAACPAAVTAAMTAHPTMNITYVNGKVIVAANDLNDGLHPGTKGQADYRAALN